MNSVEYKSRMFAVSITVIQIAGFFFHLVLLVLSIQVVLQILGIIFSVVILGLLLRRHQYVIPWIRAWAAVEAVSGAVFFVSSFGIFFLSSELSGSQLLWKLLQGTVSISLGVLYYFLTPKYIVPTLIETIGASPETVTAEQLKIRR